MQLRKELKNYLDKENKVKSWPSKEKYKIIVLEYLASNFTLGASYTEKEVNDILDEKCIVGDSCFFRRELFDRGFLDRSNDGRQYWKVPSALIDESGETNNLIIKNSTIEECESLQKLYEAGIYLKDIMGEAFDSDHIYVCLTEGDLPPTPYAKKDYYRIKSIYMKNTTQLIGFIDMYHGYPEDKTLWISLMFIHPDYQKSGFGGEVIEYLCSQAQKLKFERVGLGVSLKNWPALRFWHKHKFEKIISISGAEDFSADAIAYIGLIRELE